jgi:hypothetical protein
MDRIRRELEDLETQLDGLNRQGVEAELREELRALADRIDTLLGEEPERVEPAEPRDLSDRLSDLALRFEAEHPALTEVMGRLASALSRLGI